MQLTGHKTRSVFERYNIVSDGDLRRRGAAARRVEPGEGESYDFSYGRPDSEGAPMMEASEFPK